MQTTFRLNASELPQLVSLLKTLFRKEKVVEVTVNAVSKNILEKEETREEYWKRIEKSIKDIDEGKNIISFTAEEFVKYSDDLAAKHKR